MFSADGNSLLEARLSRRGAFSIIGGVALACAAVLGMDIYQDWALEENPLWSILAENLVPILLAVGIAAVGWKLAWGSSEGIYVSEGAKWALAGFTGTALLAGAALGIQALQGQLQLHVILTHLTTLGSAAGLFVGYRVAREKRARKELSEQEAWARGLANSIPGIVFQAYERTDGSFGSNFVSDHAEDLLGISADPKGFHSRFTERIPPSHREEFLTSVEAAFEDKEPWQIEIPFEKPSGERIWLLGASTPQRQGEEWVFNGVLLDATDRKRAEQALREQRDRFATLFDNLPTPVVEGEADEEGRIRIRELNAAFESVFGLDETDVRGEDLQHLLVPEGKQEEAKQLRHRLLAGEAVDHEVQRQAADGLRDFRLQVALRDEGPNPTEGYAIYTDITERKESERELRNTKRLLEKTIESLSEAVLVVDPSDRGILMCNATVEEIFGYDREELIGESTEMLHVDREAYERFGENGEPALERQGRFECEYQMRRKDGQIIDTEHVVTPLQSEQWPEGVVSVVRDITERKQREERLRMLSEAVEQAREAVLITEAAPIEEPGPRIVFANSAFERMTGYDEGEVLGKTPRILQGPDTDREVLDSLRTALVEENEWTGETINYRKDGTPYILQWNVAPVRSESEEVEYWVSVQRDVTEEREREQALRRNRERYRSLFRDSNDAILVHDLEGRVQEANPKAESLLGYGAEALKNQTVFDLHPPEERETAREKLKALRAGEEFRSVTRYRRADGSSFWGEVSATATEIDGETIVRSMIRDVSERERTRRQLERYNEYTERLLNASDDLFFVTDEEGNLQRWNEQIAAVTGYSDDEITGKNVFDFVPESIHRRAAAALAEVFDQGHAQLETPIVKKDGSAVPYEFSANCVEHPDGDLRLVSIGRDVTERKEREQALLAAKKEAEEANRLKSAMLANMSHEIRTPLTSITGFAELLTDQLEEGEPAEFSKRLLRSSQRLKKTIHSVLELSKLEAGVYELEREPVCFDAVVRESVDLMNQTAEVKDVTLEASLPEGPVEGLCNEGALNRIVENLIDNAIKFTPPEGHVAVRLRETDSEVTLEVEDTGIGISEEVRPKIFKAFKQESEGLGREFEGTGLGLSIVKSLTDALGGSIDVESEKGKGTCVTVRLPIRPVERGDQKG